MQFLTCQWSQTLPMSSERSAVNHYRLHRSFMNIRNCPGLVIRSYSSLTPIKANNGLFVGRTVKIQIPGDLKSRIDGCRKSCAALKDDFYSRLHLDTNTQVKEIKAGLHQTGTFLLVWQVLSLIIHDRHRTGVRGNQGRQTRYFLVPVLFDN